MENSAAKMTDRELHCVARMLQSQWRNAGISCLHCKYGLECSKRLREGERYPFHETWDKLKKLTGVNVRLHRESKDILDGSWIEHFPELYEEFLNLSIKEQEKRLHDPDILKYADEYCPENSELNELQAEKSASNLEEGKCDEGEKKEKTKPDHIKQQTCFSVVLNIKAADGCGYDEICKSIQAAVRDLVEELSMEEKAWLKEKK